jgi:hypothetical protein
MLYDVFSHRIVFESCLEILPTASGDRFANIYAIFVPN